MKKKQWNIGPEAPQEYVERLGQDGIHRILAQVVYNRGYTTPEAALEFVRIESPGDESPAAASDPFLMKGMEQAVDCLLDAVEAGERVAVYGDFDCDGVTSTVLLTEVLRRLAEEKNDNSRQSIRPYIPDRVDEGYGLNSPALKSLADEGCRVVVTVDCGIRSVQEVEDGNSYGLAMILSDHHSIGPELPPALAVLNPKQDGCDYPEKMLAGVGLAYKLTQALHFEAKRRGYAGIDEWSPDDWLDLVAIGTVADIAPLRGENRILVRQGLKRLNYPQRIGLRALYGAAGIRPGSISATTIGFIIGPRINAAGRLRSAYDAAKLLTARDEQEAARLAENLNAINQERQQKTRQMQEWAEELMSLDPTEAPSLLFASDSRFEQGIVGLVASRLTEDHYRPSAVVQLGEHESHGSCRSIPEFHMTHALDQCDDLLERYGGHAAAAGFTVRNENIVRLRERLVDVAGSELGGKELYPALEIDAELRLHECRFDLVDQLARLEPCGEANRAPVFLTRGVMISGRRQIGADGKHLKLELTAGGAPVEAIAFRMGEEHDNLPLYADVVFAIEANTWNGQRRLQLNIQDIRPAVEQ